MSVGRISHLDQPTLLRIQAGCNYVNAEIAKLRNQVISGWIVGICVAGIAYLILWHNGQRDPRIPIGIVVVIVGFVTRRAQQSLKKTYKHIVVQRVVKAIGQGLTYRPDSTLTKQDFNDMHLFDRSAEKWTSEDEVCGRKNAVSYSLHECHAWYEVHSNKRRRRITIFRGVIVRLDFNKNFLGHTVVVTESTGKILGGLFGDAESRKGKRIVRLENVDFEKQFTAYSTDDQEARYILTPKLMELMMEAQALLGAHGDLRFSFHDNSMFVTVPEPNDRFEASLFGAKVTPESVMGDLAETVRLAERLVDTLDLETRIWTRV